MFMEHLFLCVSMWKHSSGLLYNLLYKAWDLHVDLFACAVKFSHHTDHAKIRFSPQKYPILFIVVIISDLTEAHTALAGTVYALMTQANKEMTKNPECMFTHVSIIFHYHNHFHLFVCLFVNKMQMLEAEEYLVHNSCSFPNIVKMSPL